MKKALFYLMLLTFALSLPGLAAEPPKPVMELRNLSCNEYEFDASLSGDSGKKPLAYQWDFGDGTSSDQPRIRHVYENSGTYRVSLTVIRLEDGQSASTAQPVEIHMPPKIILNAPLTGCLKEEVLLEASVASPAETPEPVFRWDFGDGQTAEGKSVRHKYEKSGNYKIVLKADDGKNLECSVSEKTWVVHVNTRPVAVLNKVAPVCFEKKNTIKFEAKSSHDPDGQPLTFRWDFGDGTSQEGGKKTRHKFKKPGTYKVVLWVDDGTQSACSSGRDKIYIKLNTPPVAHAETPPLCKIKEPAVFDAGKSMDPDGDSLRYEWKFGDGKTSREMKATHAYARKGRYKATLYVDDNSGTSCSGSSEKFKVTVE